MPDQRDIIPDDVKQVIRDSFFKDLKDDARTRAATSSRRVTAGFPTHAVQLVQTAEKAPFYSHLRQYN